MGVERESPANSTANLTMQEEAKEVSQSVVVGGEEEEDEDFY